MSPSAEDRLERQEVLSYLASRYERASARLRDSQWESFRAFVRLWLETYDWRTDDGVARTLGLGESQRRDRFARFLRQAASWDVTLEFPVDAEERRSRERARWRREFTERRRRVSQRAEEQAARWEEVERLLAREQAVRRMSPEMRRAFERLDLPPHATLSTARERFRELARRHHPDVSGRTRDMQELNEAWQLLAEWFLS